MVTTTPATSPVVVAGATRPWAAPSEARTKLNSPTWAMPTATCGAWTPFIRRNGTSARAGSAFAPATRAPSSTAHGQAPATERR